MGNDQALFYRLPIADVKILLRRSVTFFGIEFPVKHELDALYDPVDFERGKPFLDLLHVYAVPSFDQPEHKKPFYNKRSYNSI